MAASTSEDDRKMFAEELKAMRAKRGWSAEEVADRIRFSKSTVRSIEAGTRTPTATQAALLDDAFETPGTFSRMERRLRGVPFSAGFRPFASCEQRARALRWFEHSTVPGLFQTENYARAILATFPETSEDDLKERLTGRMERQAILVREDPPPPRVWALLDEQVLHRDIAGPAAMADQMEHLAELARMPGVNVQIIPADRPHPGLMGAFVIAETGQSPAAVFLETAWDGQVVEDPDMAESMTLMFDTLRMEALTGSASLSKIEEAAQRWKEHAET